MRCPPSTTRWASSCTGRSARPRGAAAPRARADLFAAKGLLEAVFAALRVPLAVEEPGRPPPRSCTPGEPPRVLTGEDRVGFLGEVHPLVAADWDFDEPVAAFAIDLGAWWRARRRSSTYSDLVTFPALRQDLALSVPARTPAADVVAVIREGGGELLRDVRIFDVYAGEQVGEGRRSLAMHLEFRAADRTLTDEEVDERVERDPARRPRPSSGRAACLSSRPSSPARPATPARWPRRCCTATRCFELVAVTSRSDAGRRLDDLYPQHRVPLVMDAFDPDELGTVDAAIVAYPHGAAAPVVAALLERGVRVVDLSADFRLRDLAVYDGLVRRARRARALGEGVYGLPELRRDEVREADLVANPGCYPTATLLGLAPLARAGLSPTSSSTRSPACPGAGRARDPDDALRLGQRERDALRRRPPPPHGRDRPGAARPRRRRRGRRPSPRTCCRSTRASSSPATSRRRGRVDGDALGELYAQDYAGGAVRRAGRAAARRARRARRPTSAASTSTPTGGRARSFVFAAIDNLWKGASSQAVQNLNLMFGLDERTGL